MFRLGLWCVPCSPRLNTLWMRCPVLGQCLSTWNTLTGLSPLLTSASRCKHAVRDVYMNRLLWMLWHFNFIFTNLCLRVFLVSLTPSVEALSLPLARAMHAVSVLTWRTRFLPNCLRFCWKMHGISFQDANMNKTGQFRFTPPTHTLLAFKKALEEYHAEGGLEGRMTRCFYDAI